MTEANQRVLRLEEIPWSRVAALDQDRTAVFLPSGPIEQHGHHLPLGADLLHARAVLEAIAERVAAEGWHALVAPALPYTTAVLSRSYPGSTSVGAVGPDSIELRQLLKKSLLGRLLAKLFHPSSVQLTGKHQEKR